MPQTASSASTTRIRVWDLPTRLFHWLLVILIALLVATGLGGRLDLHMLLGQAVLALVLFRVLWGFAGNRYARFASFVAGPGAVLRYLAGLLRPDQKPGEVGHNPAGGWSVLLMLALVLVQATTGLFTSDDIVVDGPLYPLVSSSIAAQLSTIHRTAFILLLAVIGLHVAASLFYLTVRKQNLIGPMVTGRAEGRAEADAGNGGHPLLALALLLLSGAVVFGGIAILS
ncbi:cytochrome b/b6 domain-containing protein [Ferrovibrio sp.]|uniref:cytochrome b/b6 domain-containing protein n=1 Tax=Ferrovibrio sp. TaxID=1917215 RepID=UPI003518EBDA